jgi:mono/diheme cytochrome c family protein
MFTKSLMMLGTLLIATTVCLAQEKAATKPVVKKAPIQQTSAASGKDMFNQYCAPCHGADGKGNGPAAPSMKSMPTDLSQLAKKNDGKFPSAKLSSTLNFGSGVPSHGSADMPVWGPLFRSLDKYHDSVVQQRVANLVGYIETLQVK